VGDEIAIPDNTGFSTGNHVHMGAYRVFDSNTFIDKNNANGSFNFAPYYNGYSAVDSKSVVAIYKKIKELLANFLSTHK
jgi:murein DD-endopeptidase MepM/ murein hydrolase activator NlpD